MVKLKVNVLCRKVTKKSGQKFLHGKFCYVSRGECFFWLGQREYILRIRLQRFKTVPFS